MNEPLPAITPVQIHSPRIIGAIYGLFRNLEIHDESNQLFARLTQETLEAIRSFESEVGEAFTLQMYGQELVVCSRLLRLDDAAFERAEKLAELLVRAGIGGLMVRSNTSQEDLQCFCRDLSESLKREDTALTRGAYGEIRFASLEEDPSTALGTQPEQLALWLFATLLDLSADLADARALGRHPSLLPLKRVLQRIIEAARGNGAVFQLLPAIRDYGSQLGLPHRAVCEALAALGFGIRLGLSRRELLANSVAAILCRISQQEGDAVADLLAYRGLGELGSVVLLAAHDVVHPGHDAGLAGQLLTLVRSYEEALSPQGGGLAPAQAISGVLSAPPPGVESELVSMFARWQGAEPLGSPIELEGGQLALVLGPSASQSGCSRVATLEPNARLGAELDLGAPDAPTVQGHPSPAQLQLDLCRVRTGN